MNDFLGHPVVANGYCSYHTTGRYSESFILLVKNVTAHQATGIVLKSSRDTAVGDVIRMVSSANCLVLPSEMTLDLQQITDDWSLD